MTLNRTRTRRTPTLGEQDKKYKNISQIIHVPRGKWLKRQISQNKRRPKNNTSQTVD